MVRNRPKLELSVIIPGEKSIESVVLPGDVVLTCWTEDSPHLEHSVLIWSPINTTDEAGKSARATVGMPESTKLKAGETALERLRPEPTAFEQMVVVGKVFEDPNLNDDCRLNLAEESRRKEFKWIPRTRTYRHFPKLIKTDCTGFVCSAFRMGEQEVKLLEDDFGPGKKFVCPATNKERTYPTPGHLARVFAECKERYSPADSDDAERWKLARATRDDLTLRKVSFWRRVINFFRKLISAKK